MVYNNRMIGVVRDTDGELILPRVPKHKSNSMKCENCAWTTQSAKKPNNVMYTMKRIYIRTDKEWKTIGWYCPECGSVVLDELIRKDRFSPIPSPKITVIK